MANRSSVGLRDFHVPARHDFALEQLLRPRQLGQSALVLAFRRPQVGFRRRHLSLRVLNRLLRKGSGALELALPVQFPLRGGNFRPSDGYLGLGLLPAGNGFREVSPSIGQLNRPDDCQDFTGSNYLAGRCFEPGDPAGNRCRHLRDMILIHLTRSRKQQGIPGYAAAHDRRLESRHPCSIGAQLHCVGLPQRLGRFGLRADAGGLRVHNGIHA
jgi:hypothetical protein